MIVLEIKDLYKSFKNSSLTTEVLKGISFSIEEGDFILITGTSGSGKTTLLNCISGLDTITSGEVIIKDKNLSKISSREMALLRKNNIGFVFQSYNLLPNLTLYENIEIAAIIANNLDKERINSLLKNFNLYDFRNYFPEQVSGGMQQRCAIVRALINNPDIIFADEPTGNLDSKSSLEVMETFKKLHDEYNKTIVMVTHSLDNLKFGNRHIQIIDGKVINDERINNA